MGIDATKPLGQDFAARLTISDAQRARARGVRSFGTDKGSAEGKRDGKHGQAKGAGKSGVHGCCSVATRGERLRWHAARWVTIIPLGKNALSETAHPPHLHREQGWLKNCCGVWNRIGKGGYRTGTRGSSDDVLLFGGRDPRWDSVMIYAVARRSNHRRRCPGRRVSWSRSRLRDRDAAREWSASPASVSQTGGRRALCLPGRRA
jgi:hypothetical protein